MSWRMKAKYYEACNCAYGCPCNMNGFPTHGYCAGTVAFAVTEGDRDGVDLAGAKVAGAVKWPGAIHEGNGEAIAFVDERANDAQRDALLKIMTGQDTDPFATMFAVYASTVTTMHPPVFTPIDLEIDVARRTGRVAVAGYFEMTGEPIRNAVSGEESVARIWLPNGFEYEVAEIGSATSHSQGPVQVSIDAKYGQFANLHLNNHGVVKGRREALPA